MFFSNKPTIIVFIERNKLQLFPKGGTAPLAIPDTAVQYLELRNPAALKEAVAGYADKAKMRGKRLIVLLGKDVVFQKAVPLQKDTDTIAVKADFEDKMPFNVEDRQVFSLQQKDRQYLFGTNKTFYRTITAALEGVGAKMVAVTPAVVYGVTDTDKLTPAKITQVLDAQRLTKAADFLTHS